MDSLETNTTSERSDSEAPRTFISYSWSSPEHEQWVLQLASELEQSGVAIILDKWDLREGADKFAFMEKMVTDSSIRKVIVVCDRIYAEKADGRLGGVGTETQIISRELYEQIDATDQKQKFVAIITEKTNDGKAYVPTFLKSRIYIDMSDSALRSESFEQLVRWIYDKPLHKRPERGRPPAHIFVDDALSLGTTSRFRLAMEALRHDKPSTLGALVDYFNTFAENLNVFRIESINDQEFDEEVLQSIERFLPYRDEVVDLLIAIAQYRATTETYELVQQFFERLLPYGYWPAGVSTWKEWNADNFKFINNELFLYAIAALLKNGRYEGVNLLTERGYYIARPSPDFSSQNMLGFTFFRTYLKTLEYRNKRLRLERVDLMADLLRERAKRTDITFQDLSQTDLVLFLRDELHPDDSLNQFHSWYPTTLLYSVNRFTPFEIFARSQSKKCFDRVKIALGIETKEQLERLVAEFKTGSRQLPRFGYRPIGVAELIGLDHIATRP